MHFAYHIRNLRFQRKSSENEFVLEIEKLDIGCGELLAFVGASGCGKSTLIDILAFLLGHHGADAFDFCPAPRAGVADMTLLQGQRSNFLAAMRRNYIGYVPQIGGLVPSLSALNNIELPCRLSGRYDASYIRHLVSVLRLEGCLGSKPSQLSVGERQRVAIARAIAHRPSVIIADEPTAALDPHNSASVMRLFTELVRSQGNTLVLVSHDRDSLAKLGIREIELFPRMEGQRIISSFDHSMRGLSHA